MENDGQYDYTYDAEGNLILRTDTAQSRSLVFEWDNRNRLTAIHEWTWAQSGSQVIYDLEYEYDVFDRRIGRKETIHNYADGGEGGSQELDPTIHAEKFIYDGDHIVFDFASSDGEVFTLAKRYLYGPAVDQILAQENVDDAIITDPDRVYWMLTDNQGTVRDIVNSNGALVEHYTYTAFGTLLTGNTSLTRYLYTGRELDATTGLQYNRARWYDSHSGRWLSEDPLGFAGGDTNLYRYAGNGPNNGTDPSGLWAIVFEPTEGYRPIEKPGWLPIPDWIWDSFTEPDASDFIMPISGMAKKVGAKAAGRVVKGLVGEVGEKAAARVGAEGAEKIVASQIHHIATNKGDWGKTFEALFKRAGLSIDDPINKMDLPAHVGRHIDEYHRYVFNRLQSALTGKRGKDASEALIDELQRLHRQLTKNPRLPYSDGGLR